MRDVKCDGATVSILLE